MADTKITALAAITTVDPAADVLPIVDISDTSMAASGTTKKITSNQILGAGGTATLASATITGDLTVDTSTLKVDSTNNRVGVLTATPRVSLDVASGDIYSAGQVTWGGSSPTANQGFLSYTGGNAVVGSTGATSLLFYTNGAERYSIGSTGISTWSVGGSTAMTLNSTGLGVGVTPGTWSLGKALELAGAGNALWSPATSDIRITAGVRYDGSYKYAVNGASVNAYEISNGTYIWRTAGSGTAGNAVTFTQAMTLDASGRLFVGATSITAGYTGNNYLIVGGVASPTIKLQSTTGPAAWDIYSAGGGDLFVAYNASDKGQFSSSTGVYTALSDANKKKDFEPSNIGLAEVLKLKPTLFRMIGAADSSAKELGFVAQDVQSVIPQAYVETESQGGKFIGLQDRPIIAALTRAIQELTARVEALEA